LISLIRFFEQMPFLGSGFSWKVHIIMNAFELLNRQLCAVKFRRFLSLAGICKPSSFFKAKLS